MGKILGAVIVLVSAYFIVVNGKVLFDKFRKKLKKKRRLEELKDCESVSTEKESQDK